MDKNIREKKRRRIELGNIDIHDLNGTLREVIEQLQNFEKDEFEEILVEPNIDFYDGNGGYAQLDIYGYRMETNEELEARIDQLNKVELQKYLNEQKKIEDEKRLYQQLKEKYEFTNS